MSLERLLTLWDLSSDNGVDERVIRSLVGQCQVRIIIACYHDTAAMWLHS